LIIKDKGMFFSKKTPKEEKRIPLLSPVSGEKLNL